MKVGLEWCAVSLFRGSTRIIARSHNRIRGTDGNVLQHFFLPAKVDHSSMFPALISTETHVPSGKHKKITRLYIYIYGKSPFFFIGKSILDSQSWNKGRELPAPRTIQQKLAKKRIVLRTQRRSALFFVPLGAGWVGWKGGWTEDELWVITTNPIDGLSLEDEHGWTKGWWLSLIMSERWTREIYYDLLKGRRLKTLWVSRKIIRSRPRRSWSTSILVANGTHGALLVTCLSRTETLIYIILLLVPVAWPQGVPAAVFREQEGTWFKVIRMTLNHQSWDELFYIFGDPQVHNTGWGMPLTSSDLESQI